MKTKITLILILSFLIFGALIYHHFEHQDANDSSNCIIDDPITDINFTIDIDCKKNEDYQPFYIDLLNSYTIVGKITKKGKEFRTSGIDAIEIEQIEFKIFKPDTCNMYYIKSVNYAVPECNDLGVNKPSHAIYFDITRKKPKKSSAILDTKFIMKENERLSIVIDGLRQLRTYQNPCRINELNPKFIPPFICQGRVTFGPDTE